MMGKCALCTSVAGFDFHQNLMSWFSHGPLLIGEEDGQGRDLMSCGECQTEKEKRKEGVENKFI